MTAIDRRVGRKANQFQVKEWIKVRCNHRIFGLEGMLKLFT